MCFFQKSGCQCEISSFSSYIARESCKVVTTFMAKLHFSRSPQYTPLTHELIYMVLAFLQADHRESCKVITNFMAKLHFSRRLLQYTPLTHELIYMVLAFLHDDRPRKLQGHHKFYGKAALFAEPTAHPTSTCSYFNGPWLQSGFRPRKLQGHHNFYGKAALFAEPTVHPTNT
jgi:hypothetical protein